MWLVDVLLTVGAWVDAVVRTVHWWGPPVLVAVVLLWISTRTWARTSPDDDPHGPGTGPLRCTNAAPDDDPDGRRP